MFIKPFQQLSLLRIHLLWGVGFFGLALAFGTYQLGEESLWIDEAITYGRSVLLGRYSAHL